METLDLPLIWALVIGLALFFYVALDGSDLGVGILFPHAGSRADRELMMRSIAPVWDGNETWLALAGIGLLGAFPKAYAAFIPSVYMPVTVLLAALVARAVAVELRGRTMERPQRIWDHVFALGSLAAAAAQGFILGAFLQGTRLSGTRFSGAALDWLTPFSVLVAVAVVAGYALLGATWLILKTRGDLVVRARAWAARLTLVVIAAMVVVGLFVLAFDTQPGRRWGIAWPLIDLERLLPLAPIPIAVAGLGLWLRGALGARRDGVPFYCAQGLFALAFLGLAISVFPYAVPWRMTLWDAAAAPNAQAVLLLGVLVVLPLVITYTGYVYWVFRGKVGDTASPLRSEEVGRGAHT